MRTYCITSMRYQTSYLCWKKQRTSTIVTMHISCGFSRIFKGSSQIFELVVNCIAQYFFFSFRLSSFSSIYMHDSIYIYNSYDVPDGIFRLCTSLLLQFPTFPKPVSIERALRRFYSPTFLSLPKGFCTSLWEIILRPKSPWRLIMHYQQQVDNLLQIYIADDPAKTPHNIIVIL